MLGGSLSWMLRCFFFENVGIVSQFGLSLIQGQVCRSNRGGILNGERGPGHDTAADSSAPQ